MNDRLEGALDHPVPASDALAVPRRPQTLAVAWAWSAPVRSASDRLVLVALAQHVDRFGCTVVGQRRLARLSGLCERTVRATLRRLTDAGMIGRIRRITRHGGRTTDAVLLQRWPERVPLPDGGHPRWGPRIAETLDSLLARREAQSSRQDLPPPPEGRAGLEQIQVNSTTSFCNEGDDALRAALAALGPWATPANRAFLTADLQVLEDWRRRGLDILRDLAPILARRAATGREAPVLRSWRYFEAAIAHLLAPDAVPRPGANGLSRPVVSDALLRSLVGASARRHCPGH